MVGGLTQEQVMQMYTKTVLIFPSFIETFGMPLLEARMTGTPICAGHSCFAKEIIGDYEKAEWFMCNDVNSIADSMKRIIDNDINKKYAENLKENVQSKTIIDILLEI